MSAALTAVAMLAGLLTITAAPASAASPVGYLDTVRIDDRGFIHVTGWARDDDAPGTPIEVHFYARRPDGTEVGIGGVLADRQREAAVGKHGFVAKLDHQLAGRLTIHAFGINVGGTEGVNHPLTNEFDVDLAYPNPFLRESRLEFGPRRLTVKGLAEDAGARRGESFRVTLTINDRVRDRRRVGVGQRFRVTAKHPFKPFTWCLKVSNIGAGGDLRQCSDGYVLGMTQPGRGTTRDARVPVAWRLRAPGQQLYLSGNPAALRVRSAPAGTTRWTRWSTPKRWRGLTEHTVRSSRLRRGRTYCFSSRVSVNESFRFTWAPPRCVTRR